MNPCEAIANAIIIQAVKDYRHALGTLKYYPNDRKATLPLRLTAWRLRLPLLSPWLARKCLWHQPLF